MSDATACRWCGWLLSWPLSHDACGPGGVVVESARCPGCGHADCPRPRGWSSLECDWEPEYLEDWKP